MKAKIILSSAVVVVVLLAVTFILYITMPALTASTDTEVSGKQPKNIILFIGDGMGYNHVAVSRYYEQGDEEKLCYEEFPVQCGMSTYPAKSGGYPDDLVWSGAYNPSLAWTDFDYLREKYTDSGASATALGTGVKSYNNSIGVDIDGNTLTNVLERAKEFGKSTGVLTSVPFNHATPAGFTAHYKTRSDYHTLAELMLLDSRLDLIIGSGHPFYDNSGSKLEEADYKFIDSPLFTFIQSDSLQLHSDFNGNSVEDMDGDGSIDSWTFLDGKSELESFSSKNYKRIFGLAEVHSTLQAERKTGEENDDEEEPEAKPFEIPFNDNVPSLSDLTKQTLAFLSKNENGFVVMIEGGAIDWASHANNSARLIEEMRDFNQSVAEAISWVESSSSWDETVIIVTADHETGFIWGPDSGGDSFVPVGNNGKGNVPDFEWYSGSHTNSLVPVYAKGSGSETVMQFADEVDPERGNYITNSEIAQIIFRLLEQ